MSVDTVQLILKRAGDVAGLDFQVRPHMWRHACGFTLAEAGTDTITSGTSRATERSCLAEWGARRVSRWSSIQTCN